MADAETTVVEEKEDLDVEARFLWAFDRFLSLGFQEELAELLAREKVDWHQVKKMMDEGCSQNHILRILLVIEAIVSKCDWCEDEATFSGEDPEKEWREAGWLTHVDEDGERDYCSLGCCISALN